MAISAEEKSISNEPNSVENQLYSNFDDSNFLYPDSLPRWEELDRTPHKAFYRDSEGRKFYITDTHKGRLRKNGKRYSAILKEDVGEIKVIDEANELENLNLDQINMTVEEALENRNKEEDYPEIYQTDEDTTIFAYNGEVKVRNRRPDGGRPEGSQAIETLGKPQINPGRFLEKAKNNGWSAPQIRDRLNGFPAGAD